MPADKKTPVRFGLLTVFVWLLVAGGIITLLWKVINQISNSNIPLSTSTANPTQVYQTIAAVLTAQASSPATPLAQTDTPSPTVLQTAISPTPLPSPKETNMQGTPTNTVGPRVLCNQAAAGNPIDITIPDDSLINPGQSFIKTWKLVNAGTCTWTKSYSVSFFYGDRMGAPENVPLPESVRPAQSVEISVDMEAPIEPGTYQGNWKLADPDGILFGIGPNGDSPFWVRIMVAESPTTTPNVSSTPTATSSPTGNVTPSPTPEGQTSGELSPVPGDAIDLDGLVLNRGKTDLVYQGDAEHIHWLSPYGGAMIGVYSSQQPALENCQNANMSSAPIAVESLPIDTYLCYFTGEGRFGRMLLVALDPDSFTLTMDLLTWALP